MKVNELAVETRFWPVYEVENGKYTINYIPKERVPVEEFLKLQKRFKHIFKPGNEWMIEEIQAEVDARWDELMKLAEMSK